MDIIAKEIRCPSPDNHKHKKILLVVAEDHLSVHCGEHGWIKIELRSEGEPISFKNPSAIVSSHGLKASFSLSQIPIVAKGKFPLKRRRCASVSKV